jgi:hypothetical protein
MYPDVQTMAAHARIDQWLRDAAEARLAAQARGGRRHSRPQAHQLAEVAA